MLMEGGYAPRVHAHLGVHSWQNVTSQPTMNVMQTPHVERRGVLPWPPTASRLTFTPPPRSFPWPMGTVSPVSPVVVNGILVHTPPSASSPGEADSPANALTPSRQVVRALPRQSTPLTPSIVARGPGPFGAQAPVVLGQSSCPTAQTLVRGVPAHISYHEAEASSVSSWIRSSMRSSSPVTDSPVSPGQEFVAEAFASPRDFDCPSQVAALRACELKAQRRPSPLSSHNQQATAVTINGDSALAISADHGDKMERNLRPHLYQNYPTPGIYT